MKSSSLAYLSLPSANLNIRKTKSIFCCPGNALISEKLLDFTFSKGRFLGLRPEILSTILNIYNSRLFSEFLQKNKATLKLLKSDEVGQDFSQSIIPKIDVSEIEMGELGNSLFISAISALIETPIILFGLIDQINLSKTENIYIIFINQNGSWRELFLDGMFPYQIDFILEDNKGLGASAKKNSTKKEIEKKTLYFSRLKNNSANWLSLLEKAYAFAYGSYQKMLNCLLEDILYDFTGAVVETNEIIRMSNFELGDLLLKDFNKGSPMLLIEEDISDRLNNLYLKKETCNQWGIPIIDVRNTKTEYIIVKIRTLKPIKTQKLMYNKGSNNWPPDLKAELAIKFDPANAIWLSLDEIKEMFSNLIICKVNMQNFHKSIVFEFSNFDALSYAICEIQHNENFLLGITVCQDDLREFKLASKYK